MSEYERRKRPNARKEIIANQVEIAKMLKEGHYIVDIYEKLHEENKVTVSKRGFYHALNRELNPETNNANRSGTLAEFMDDEDSENTGN